MNEVYDNVVVDNLNSLVTIYTINDGVNSICFETESERNEWINENKPPVCIKYTISYIGHIAGRDHVFREENPALGNKLIHVVDSNYYEVYSESGSKIRNEYVWHSITSGNPLDKIRIFKALGEKVKNQKKNSISSSMM